MDKNGVILCQEPTIPSSTMLRRIGSTPPNSITSPTVATREPAKNDDPLREKGLARTYEQRWGAVSDLRRVVTPLR